MSTNPWTDERIDALKNLWADGLSCSQIAAELACGLTRNAVIGKISRLGLQRTKRLVPRTYKKREPKAAKPTRFALSFNAATITKIPVADVVERTAAVEPLHLDLMELTPASCRWPYGDGPFTFCGCQAQPDKPYCDAHVRLSSAPRPQRQKKVVAPPVEWKPKRNFAGAWA